VSHTEEIIVIAGLDVLLNAGSEDKPRGTIDKKGSLRRFRDLPVDKTGSRPGSRRITCLTDGSTLVRQVLQRERRTTFQFRYVV